MVRPSQDFLLLIAEIKIPEGFLRRFQQTPAQLRLKRRLDEQLVYSWFGQVGCSLRQTAFPVKGIRARILNLHRGPIASREDRS
jgi:hypothetical protein